jgi:beta-1,4-mannosyl-glycoprotein beta-1,4-N-acetylglucosaminyltransferase
MIYDCFPFFNELDLLEIRLNILNDVVDRFVIVEGTKTHTNKTKSLFFKKNRKRYAKFNNKITYIVVDDFPDFVDTWGYEIFQRNCISRGLVNCKPDDVILISDLDEIPNPDVIVRFCERPGIQVLKQKFFYYYLNCENQKHRYWLAGTRMLHYQDLTGTVTDITKKKGKKIPHGGWHFSYLGGVDKIIDKIESFAHSEYNTEYYKNPERIKRLIKERKDIFDRRDYTFKVVKIDNTFPEYIRRNTERLKHLIFTTES